MILGFRMGFCAGAWRASIFCGSGFAAGSFSDGFSAMGVFIDGFRMLTFSIGFSGAAVIGLSTGFSVGVEGFASSLPDESDLSSMAARVSSSFFIRSSSFCCFDALESSFFGFLSNKPILYPNLYYLTLLFTLKARKNYKVTVLYTKINQYIFCYVYLRLTFLCFWPLCIITFFSFQKNTMPLGENATIPLASSCTPGRTPRSFWRRANMMPRVNAYRSPGCC